MLSTPNADKTWKGMTRSFPTPEAPGQYAAPSKAERTAYAVLRGPGGPGVAYLNLSSVAPGERPPGSPGRPGR